MNTKNAIVVQVKLPTESYPILCGSGLLTNAGEVTETSVTKTLSSIFTTLSSTSIVPISDEVVWSLHGAAVQSCFAQHGCELQKPILLSTGESQKTWETAGNIVSELASRGLRRDGALVAVGGGVIGDVCGFAAAVYMRGVRVLQIPTTLLAQVDAAIGGKTGVNLSSGKNLAGAFHQPLAVLCDVQTLSSLPMREYKAGLAEVVKYALLGDADFFDWLEKHVDDLLARHEEIILAAVARSAQHKADIVAADAHETKEMRALLNLGHTFAHALEATMGYGTWLHGEAVAVGLVAAAQLSHLKNDLPLKDVERIRQLLARLQLPVCFPVDAKSDDLCARMQIDKKHTAQQTRFILLDKIGLAKRQVVDIDSAHAVIESLR